jgi:hypothetical protein
MKHTHFSLKVTDMQLNEKKGKKKERKKWKSSDCDIAWPVQKDRGATLLRNVSQIAYESSQESPERQSQFSQLWKLRKLKWNTHFRYVLFPFFCVYNG